MQSYRVDQIRQTLRALRRRWEGEFPESGYGAILWKPHLLTVARRDMSHVHSHTHVCVFYELRMAERSGHNKKAPAVVGATIFRKHGTREMGGRPWSTDFFGRLQAEVLHHKPVFVSPVFENPPVR